MNSADQQDQAQQHLNDAVANNDQQHQQQVTTNSSDYYYYDNHLVNSGAAPSATIGSEQEQFYSSFSVKDPPRHKTGESLKLEEPSQNTAIETDKFFAQDDILKDA